jgi:tRNA pseudouridine65 synthase
LQRLLLISKSLSFIHPVTEQEVHIEAAVGEEVLGLFDKFGWPAQESDYLPNE